MGRLDENNEKSAKTRFVLVGHCGPDMYMLRSAVQRAIRGAEVVIANDTNALEPELQQGAVLLINRVLDWGFATESGVELIEELAKRSPAPVMVLVSNLVDAQDAAVRAGAQPGFGKAALYADSTVASLRSAAELAQQNRLTAG